MRFFLKIRQKQMLQILGGSFISLLFSCQASPTRDFTQVQIGMEKYEVLDAAGNPKIIRRTKDRDQWIYILRERGEQTQVREVQFQAGKAVYIGEETHPAVSGADQDKINAAHEIAQQKADAEALRQINDLKYSFQPRSTNPQGVSPSGSDGTLDSRLLDDIYGPSPEREQQKRAPIWHSVE